MERGLGWLADGGILSLITQNTYFEKDWAATLRGHIATQSTVEVLTDLGPFGQLFFKRMNTPAITTLRKEEPAGDALVCVVRTHPPAKWASNTVDQRRAEVTRSVSKVLTAKAPRTPLTAGVAYYTSVAQSQLKATAATRWQFDSASPVKGPRNPVPVSSILSHRQGVTPGGALDLFLLAGPKATAAKLEPELVRPAFKSRAIHAWSLPNQDLILLYPYVGEAGQLRPAFTIKHQQLSDALDFDVALDNWEATRRSAGGQWLLDTLERRIAQGLVSYPNVAKYLVSHYQRLQSRTFKHQNIRDFGRMWYEYLWPRGVEVASQVPRLVSPSLIRDMRFALDRKGLLSACNLTTVRRPS